MLLINLLLYYSFAESENDDSVGICNVSLGREIMQAVHTNETRDINKRKVHILILVKFCDCF